MTPSDQPPLFSGYLESHSSVASKELTTFLMIIIGIISVVLSRWLVPTGSLLLCLAGGGLILCGRWKEGARRYGILIAVTAALPVVLDAILFGRPAVWWLLGAIGAALVLHLLRPREASIRRILLTNLRNAAISAGIGLTMVLAIQLVLHYISEHHEELAREWTFRLGDARSWMEGFVLLGPRKLAVLLVLLIAAASIAPSLNVIRNYRRVALAAAHSLLVLVVATSFVFFGNSYARTAEWIARISMAKEHLGAIDKSHQDVVKAAVVERTITKLGIRQRSMLSALGKEIEKHVERAEIRKRLAERLLAGSSGELDLHGQSTCEQLEQSQLSAEHRRSREIIETARERIEQGESLSRADLAALKIERTAADARRQEARAAIRHLFVDAVSPPLVGETVQSMMDSVRVQGRVPPVDRAAASSATCRAHAEPPRISFDHVLPLEKDAPELLHVELSHLVRTTGLRIQAERQLAANAAEAKRSGGPSFGGGGGGGGINRASGGLMRSRGGSRFGTRRGGPLLVA